MSKKLKIIIKNFQGIGYSESLRLQQIKHQAVLNGDDPGYLLFIEHRDQVITLGKNANENHLVAKKEELAYEDISLVQIDRGGQMTAHMPGQLVIYPIIKLSEFNLTVRNFIHLLEQCVINVLSRYGINAGRRRKYPGVWVEDGKICAIGIRIKQRISMHGLALNFNGNLKIFSHFVPCGIKSAKVVNFIDCSSKPASIKGLAESFARELFLLLGLDTGDVASQTGHWDKFVDDVPWQEKSNGT